MASKAIVAILTIFALGLLAPSASGMALLKQANATAPTPAANSSASADATVISITLTFQIANINGSAAFQNALQKLKNSTDAIKQQLADAASKVNPNATTPVETVQQFLNSTAANIQNSNLTQAAKQDLSETITTLKAEIANRTAEINSAVINTLQGLVALKNLTENAAQALKGLIESGLKNMTAKANATGADVSNIVQKLNASLQNGEFDAVLKNTTSQLLSGTQLTFGDILKQLASSSQSTSGLVGNLTQALEGAIKDDLNFKVQLAAAAVAQLNAAASGLYSILGAAGLGLGGAIGGSVGAIGGSVGAIGGAVGGAVGGAATAVGGAATAAVGGAATAVGGAATAVGGAATAAVGGAATAVGGAATAVGGAATAVGTGAGGVASGILGGAAQAGAGIASGFASAVGGVASGAASAAGGLAGAIGGAFGGKPAAGASGGFSFGFGR